MVGLLGYAAAGALSGGGEGLAAQSRRAFEAMQEELRHSRQVERDEAGREFTRSENQLSRAATADNADATRDLQREMQEQRLGHASSEAALDRQHRRREGETDREFRDRMAREDREFRGDEARRDRKFRSREADKDAGRTTDRFQDNEGNWWVRSKDGTEAQPITAQADGTQLVGKTPRDPDKLTKTQKNMALARARRAATTKGLPGQKERIDWSIYVDELRAAGVEVDAEVRSLIANGLRGELAARVAKDAEERAPYALDPTGLSGEGFGDLTREQWEARELDRLVDARLTEMGIAPLRAVPSAGGSTREAGGGGAPVAPRDPAERKVGQIYSNGAGREAEWTGRGWRPLS